MYFRVCRAHRHIVNPTSSDGMTADTERSPRNHGCMVPGMAGGGVVTSRRAITAHGKNGVVMDPWFWICNTRMTVQTGCDLEINQGSAQLRITVTVNADDCGTATARRVIVAQRTGILMYTSNYALTAVGVAGIAITSPSKSRVCVTAWFKTFGGIMTSCTSGGGIMVIKQTILSPMSRLGMAYLADTGGGNLLIGKPPRSV